MIAWTEIEHLPTRKRMVRFEGTANGADIADLVADPDLCQWDGYELIIKHGDNWFRMEPGDWVIQESYRPAGAPESYRPGVYPCPEHRGVTQYRILGESS